MIEEVCRFLEGKQEDVLKDLQKQMQEAADNLQFEKAASLRDKIQAIEKILENQKIMSTSMVDQDILAFYQEEDKTSVQIFFVRSGKLISAERYILDDTADEDCKEIINSYLKQFYGNSAFIPKEILILENVDDREAIEQWLSERKGNRVYIRVPRRGEKFKLVQMALKKMQRNIYKPITVRQNVSLQEPGSCNGTAAGLEFSSISFPYGSFRYL